MKLTEICSIQVRRKCPAYDRTDVGYCMIPDGTEQGLLCLDADAVFYIISLLITIKKQHKFNIFYDNCWKFHCCLPSAVRLF
jgi:hypothetical protein